jgi:hypothetical protein
MGLLGGNLGGEFVLPQLYLVSTTTNDALLESPMVAAPIIQVDRAVKRVSANLALTVDQRSTRNWVACNG